MFKANQPMKIILTVALVAAILAGSALIGGEVTQAGTEAIDRLGGADRYATSALIAGEQFSSSSYCIVTRGDVYADGLAASTLAGALDCPVLLTRSDELPATVSSRIKSLGYPRVIILGGTSAVSTKVENALKSLVGTTKVERIGGTNRFDTAARIARRAKQEYYLPGYAFIVNGWASADSLVAGPAAFENKAPILQVEKNTIPEVTKKAISDLGITRLIIVGGTAVVSDSVKTALEKLPSVYSVTRLAGATRYETAVEFAKSQFSGVGNFSLVRGADSNLADAIGATVLGFPILYVEQNDLRSEVSKYLDQQVTGSSSIYVIGGIAAVSDTVRDRVKALVSGTAVYNPAQGATSVSTSVQPTISFPRAITLSGGGTITDSNVDSLITFRKGGSSGSSVSFTASIDSAKRVITVRPTSALETNTTYYLAVSSVRDSGGTVSGSSVTWTTGTVETGIPSSVLGLDKAECVSLREVMVYFNQSVTKTTAEKAGNYNLDVGVTISTAKLQSDGRSVLLTLDSSTPLTKNNTYLIDVDNVFSTGGRYIDEPYDIRAFRATDNTRPTVESIATTGKKTLLVTMSEYCDSTEPLVRIDNVLATFVSWDSDAKSFTVTAGSDWVKDRTYSISISRATDLAGNEMLAYVTTIKPFTDDKGPKINSISAVDQDTVKVVFDRPLDSGCFGTATVKYKKGTAESDGVFLNTEIAGAKLFTQRLDIDSSGKTYYLEIPYVITDATKLFSGTTTSETIEIQFIGLKDLLGYTGGGTSETLKKSVTLNKDTIKPYITSYDVDIESKIITLYLNEQTNETIAGTVNNITVRRSGVTVAVSAAHNNDAVNNISTITLTNAGGFEAGEHVIRIPVNTVEDGLTYTSLTYKGTGGYPDFGQNADIGLKNGNAQVDYNVNVGAPALNPKVEEVTSTGTNILEVKYNVRMGSSAINYANYKLNGVTLSSSADLYFKDDSRKVAIIDLTAEGTVNFSGAGTLTATSSIKSAVGYSITAKSITPVSELFEDNTPAKLLSAAVHRTNKTITLTFDEEMNSGVSPSGSFEITYKTSSKTVTVTLTGSTIHPDDPADNKKIVFTIEDPADHGMTWSCTVTVKTLEGGLVKDANGCYIEPGITKTATKAN